MSNCQAILRFSSTAPPTNLTSFTSRRISRTWNRLLDVSQLVRLAARHGRLTGRLLEWLNDKNLLKWNECLPKEACLGTKPFVKHNKVRGHTREVSVLFVVFLLGQLLPLFTGCLVENASLLLSFCSTSASVNILQLFSGRVLFRILLRLWFYLPIYSPFG